MILNKTIMINLALAWAVLAAVPRADAHHAVSSQYEWDKPTRWEGIVKKVDWINPHVYLYLEVASENDKSQIWRFETIPPGMLKRMGISKLDLLGRGEVIKIDGLPAREEHRLGGSVIRIIYPDGRVYQLNRDRSAVRPHPTDH